MKFKISSFPKKSNPNKLYSTYTNMRGIVLRANRWGAHSFIEGKIKLGKNPFDWIPREQIKPYKSQRFKNGFIG